jgi:hypothetical protein
VSSPDSSSRDASPQNPSLDLTNSGNPDNAKSSSATTSAEAQSPVIQINGDNPARVQVDSTYQDLGATITGPQADINLGVKTFLNGALVSDIVLDTSAAATDTVDYVATDPTGLTSTSTRLVVVDAASVPLLPDYPATTTLPTATSTTLQ